MSAGNTDQAWKYYGEKDPYYGVLTWDSFRAVSLSDRGKKAFFETGERYIDSIVKTVHEGLDPNFQPTRALDFGCGVGRLVIPLARICKSVVGVDVSEGMLSEAENNSRQQGLANVSFVKGDDALSRISGTFDFIHSFIVFQHIPPERGIAIFERMIELLKNDGIGALHFTYAPAGSMSRRRRWLRTALQSVPFFYGLRNLLKGRPFREPMMQMNVYDLNRLLRILQESGCHELAMRFTDTSAQGSGFYGVILFFRKRSLDVHAHA